MNKSEQDLFDFCIDVLLAIASFWLGLTIGAIF